MRREERRRSHWESLSVVDRETGTIWLPFCRDNKDVLVTKSIDDGVSWSDPVDITADVKNPEWSWGQPVPGLESSLTMGPTRAACLSPAIMERARRGGR